MSPSLVKLFALPRREQLLLAEAALALTPVELGAGPLAVAPDSMTRPVSAKRSIGRQHW